MLYSVVLAMDLNGYPQLNVLPEFTSMNMISIRMIESALRVSSILRPVLSSICCVQMTTL